LFIKKNLASIVHHYFGKSIFLESGLILGNYVFRTENLIGKFYKNVPMFVVSNSTKDESIKRGILENNIYFAPNGIDVKCFRENSFEKTSYPSIGYFGRLKKYKSVQHLISAFIEVKKNIPDSKLVIIGKGDFENELKKQSIESGFIEDIIFTGYVSEELKVEWLNKLWLVVNPSMKEGWGIANVEANACGTPVIVANSPGLKDSVIENFNGLLYEYGDIKRLSELIIEVINNNELRNRLSIGAKKFTDNLSWDNSANSVLKTLNNIF
jgi:glycosyltransferase involved in cell wall biosynthesis